MRVVMQRVSHASVTLCADQSVVSSINAGLMCLIGISRDDHWADAEFCVRKILGCKLWPDQGGTSEWRSNVVENDYEVLLISQFTLFGKLTKGNKPNFHEAMRSQQAFEMFNKLVELCKKEYREDKVKTGSFGNNSRILLENDGPVTIHINSAEMHLKRHNDNRKIERLTTTEINTAEDTTEPEKEEIT